MSCDIQQDQIYMILEVCGTLNISITVIWDVGVCNPADQYMFTTQR
jgi:hypothetical protein